MLLLHLLSFSPTVPDLQDPLVFDKIKHDNVNLIEHSIPQQSNTSKGNRIEKIVIAGTVESYFEKITWTFVGI